MIYTESGHLYYVDHHAYVTTFIFNNAIAEKSFQKKLIQPAGHLTPQGNTSQLRTGWLNNSYIALSPP